MNYTLNNLDILYRRVRPEKILEDFRNYRDTTKARLRYYNVPSDTFNQSAWLNLQEYTFDERRLRLDYTNDMLRTFHNDHRDIFGLLISFSEKVLRTNDNEPTCRMEYINEWNTIYNRLGQDIFVLSSLAYRDICHKQVEPEEYSFSWPSIIRSDDMRLNQIIAKGLAENHFHLKGSTQNFALTWACLMNHPEVIKKLFDKYKIFRTNLDESLILNSEDYMMDWPQRVYYAAMIRALLFRRCLSERGIEEYDGRILLSKFREFDELPMASTVYQVVRYLRYNYGKKFYQYEGGQKCIDYAITSYLYQVDEDSFVRLLGGERNFLYHCFRMQFNGSFSEEESTLLYLYLVIKCNLRAEIVQSNHVPGFQNFLYYQDRKDVLFDDFQEYDAENYRLSIADSIKANNLLKLEARIVPKESARKILAQIKNIDDKAEMAITGRQSSKIEDKILKKHRLCYHTAHFYVAHFVKSRYSKEEFAGKDRETLLVPRNKDVRKVIKQQALALADYIRICNENVGGADIRIKGIDACNVEIGCRPETFATEFRFLRAIGQLHKKKEFVEQLGVTYHVGEDFLGIVDGLRAVDEAIRYLPLRKGDRIGHGLVLGIDPREYYLDKQYEIFTTKQDLLDNIVWLLWKTSELNVKMSSAYREKLSTEARKLFYDIYKSGIMKFIDKSGEEIFDYYLSYCDSMQLRGDHPRLYINGEYKERESDLSFNGYSEYMKNGDELDVVRLNRKAARLYYLYQYDVDVKMRGLQVDSVEINDDIIELVCDLQKAMRRVVAENGLSIECNPTSNVLIGTFHRYENHPMLRFNDHKLSTKNDHRNISISINTDDLGVFDTSLSHEYALMFSAIQKKRHAEGEYDDDCIYEYLDYLRELGIEMSFS